MATKKQIAEQAMRVLSGGDLKPDREIDIREVMLYLDQVRDKALTISVYENIKNGEYRIDSHFLTYHEDVTVSIDTDKSLRYIALPATPVALPYDMGIYQISPMENQEKVFHKIEVGALAVYRSMGVLESENETFYWNVGDNVYFKGIDPVIEEVLVILAQSSSDISVTADYPVPPDMESDLVKQLVEFFSIHKQMPHDEVEDVQK